MGNCTKTGCSGTLRLYPGDYGPYWKCSKCGHTISQICICGGKRKPAIYIDDNGIRHKTTRCQKCNTCKY